MRLVRLKLKRYSNILTKTSAKLSGLVNNMFGKGQSRIQVNRDAINLRDKVLNICDAKPVYDKVAPRVAAAKRNGDVRGIITNSAKGIAAGTASFYGNNPVSSVTGSVVSKLIPIPGVNSAVGTAVGYLPGKVEQWATKRLTSAGLQKLTPKYWVDNLNNKILG